MSFMAGAGALVALACVAFAAGWLACWLARGSDRREAGRARLELAHASEKAQADAQRMSGLEARLAELEAANCALREGQSANDARTRFLATISHEIRTPLSGILGMADLLRQGALAAEQRNYVEAIRTSGASLASLIDEILDFSRIDAGRVELAEETFDVVTLVEGAVELLAPRAQDKGLEIAAAVARDVPRMLIGDPARIRQILLNLAGNAVKFTAEGGVGVRVRWAFDRVNVEVIDTGCGVPPRRREAIFEDFVQGDDATEGAGLGLAISRRLVERMGGRLRLERSSLSGSVFVFDFPLRPAETAAAAPSRLSGRRALIVGRSPFEAPFLGERLGAEGAQASRAEGAAAAVEMLREGPAPDVVIVDCALGEEDAARVAQAAREAGVARSLVLFSPFERLALAPATLGRFDGWLVKPVRSSSLLARLLDPGRNATGGDADAPASAQTPAAGSRQVEVLLAEDNEINALVARKHLERLGAAVAHANDGAAAVALAEMAARGERPPFDLMLLDLRMPRLDGLDAARRIRLIESDSGGAPTRILALSASLFSDTGSACRAAGMDDVLAKPLDPTILAREIERARKIGERPATHEAG